MKITALINAAVLATSSIPCHCGAGPLPPEVCLHAKHFLCSLLQQIGGWGLLHLQVHRERCSLISDGQAAADQLRMPRACGTKDFHIAAERRAIIQRPQASYQGWTYIFFPGSFLLLLLLVYKNSLSKHP